MRSAIRFVFDGKVQELANISPTETVLDFIRAYPKKTGTKEGCAEGDCGACTIAIGTLDGDRVKYRSVNACIQFLPTLDGSHLMTVEDLKSKNGKMHPVQQEMVNLHGTQCGYCTPGFVMSMFVLAGENNDPSKSEIEDALAGNLCRCTGYGPIIDAAKKAASSSQPLVAEGNIAALLKTIRPTEHLAIEQGSKRFFAPTNIEEFTKLYTNNPDATVLGGGTDVGLWVTKQNRKLETIIYTGNVREMLECEENDDEFRIGAAVRYSDLPTEIGEQYPDFAEILRRLGSRQIRNLGTLGGNVANGSPIGDTPPLLIAMGARIVLNKGGTRRELALEDFFIDYGKQDRMPGEFVEQIIIPKPKSDMLFRAYKISKRFDQDISALCGAFNLTVADGIISSARIAFGGMAATPKRASGAEAALIGQNTNSDTLEQACSALADDFQPISDMRASAEYRTIAAANLLRKVFAEIGDEAIPTRVLSQVKRAVT